MLNIPKEIAGTVVTWLHKKEPVWGYAERTYRYEEFRMVRLGTKEYGFIFHNDGKLSASYKCSWIEAQRRFKTLLVTWRLACT